MPSDNDAEIILGFVCIQSPKHLNLALPLFVGQPETLWSRSVPPWACCLMEPQSHSFSLHHISLHKNFPGLPTEAVKRCQSCTSLLWSLLSNLAVVASYFKLFSPVKFAGRICQLWVCLSVFEKREMAQLWQSSLSRTSPEEAQLTGEGNPRRQYGRKSLLW